MENRQYMVFNTSELNLINFNEVLQTSADSVRKSANGSKTFVKWKFKTIIDSESNESTPGADIIPEETTPVFTTVDYIPASVFNLTTKEGPYSSSEIQNILLTPEWVIEDPNPEA
jgi:hypothetical protein|tara:strand:- start:1454 stop:1798 length:345 start_codon:yes stop_codon:yes gene_type:complete